MVNTTRKLQNLSYSPFEKLEGDTKSI